MMPPLFLAIALFTAMDYFKIQPGFGPIIIGHLLIVIPFVLVVITVFALLSVLFLHRYRQMPITDGR